MEVDQIIAFVDDLFGHHEQRALGLCAVDTSGIEAIHALVVDRIHMRDFFLE